MRIPNHPAHVPPPESAPGQDARDNGGLAVLLEFSASGPAQSLSNVLTGTLPVRTLELDLIDVGYGRATDLACRTAAVADDIVAAGAPRVAVVASCAAGPALAPVAARLRQRGIRVDLAAAVDPGSVTDGHIRYTLGQIAAGLDIPDGDDTVRGVDLTGAPEPVLARIGDVLRDWVARFLATSEMDEIERELMWHDLLDRYLRWSSFLLAALDAPACDPACRLDVFLTGPAGDLGAMFGPATIMHRHRYPAGDQGLDRADLVADLRSVVGGALTA